MEDEQVVIHRGPVHNLVADMITSKILDFSQISELCGVHELLNFIFFVSKVILHICFVASVFLTWGWKEWNVC